MRYRKLDADGDYIFGRGGADFHVNSPEAVAQAISTRLRLWYGEWFLDRFDGTPWNEAVLGKHSQGFRDAAVRRVILRTDGVRRLLSFRTTYSGDNRSYRVEAVVETIYGRAELSQVFAPQQSVLIAR
jgi:hypothetical protein